MTFRTGLRLAAGLLAALQASTVAAEGLVPGFMDATYIDAQARDSAAEADGLAIDLRHALDERWFLRAGGSLATSDAEFEVIADSSSANLGLGARHAVGAATDLQFVARLEYARVEVTGLGQRVVDEDLGYSLQAGLRTMLLPNIEAGLDATWLAVMDEQNASAGVYAVAYLTKLLGVQLRYDAADDVDTYSIGLRWAWR